MHLFADYIQPVTLWLYDNPNWALLMTFFIAFLESLAIVGSIVPGGVTMTAIGILAGSGVMNISFTMIAAALGAVAGDSASYALGYAFSDHLVDMWPFRHYPRLLEYGKEYFARHGGKSVIIGRFFGPLRSIIPVIAGIMRMHPWHFLLANIISGIGWAILYVMPGILIGAASTELSTESATRLFVIILILLGLIWMTSMGIKWILLHSSHFIQTQLRKIWIWSNKHPPLARCLKALTPGHTKNKYTTTGLLLLFFVCLLASIIVTLLVVQGTWISQFNNPCYLFLQSLRTQAFDAFFIVTSLVISPFSLLALSSAITLCALYYKDWRMLRYWLSLNLITSATACLLASFIETPMLIGLLHYRTNPLYPVINLTIATALFGFLAKYASTRSWTTTMLVLRVFLTVLLMLSGLGVLYLGDNWPSSIAGAYFIGMTICLAHWIYYRRKLSGGLTPLFPSTAILCSISLLIFTTCVTSMMYYNQLVRKHSPLLKQFVLTHEAWWEQKQPLLPVYTRNRIGKRTGLFNLQYLGSLPVFEQALTEHGWKRQPDSLFYSMFMRASGQNTASEMPLMAQLYLNRKPALIMTRTSSKNQSLYILRFWRSNYHLRNHAEPIWLGSIIEIQPPSKSAVTTHLEDPARLASLLSALDQFNITSIPLPRVRNIESWRGVGQPSLLMIEKK